MIIPQMPWYQPRYRFPVVEPIKHEDVLKIHENAVRILEEIGIKFQAEEAVSSFANAGCIVGEDKTTVRIGREII